MIIFISFDYYFHKYIYGEREMLENLDTQIKKTKVKL